MSDSSSSSSASGIGFCGLLAVAFIVLKLCHVIEWSWWWVLAPLWMPIGIVLAGLLAAGIGIGVVYLIAGFHEGGRGKRERKRRERAAERGIRMDN